MAGKKCTFSNPVSENDFVLCDIVSYYFRLILRKSAYFKLGVSANLSTKRISKNHYVFISRKTRSIYVTIIIFNSSLQLFFQILPTKNHHRSSATVPRELICIKGATLAAMPIEAEQLESLGHLRRRVEV